MHAAEAAIDCCMCQLLSRKSAQVLIGCCRTRAQAVRTLLPGTHMVLMLLHPAETASSRAEPIIQATC